VLRFWPFTSKVIFLMVTVPELPSSSSVPTSNREIHKLVGHLSVVTR
jgi:hypothetical protein